VQNGASETALQKRLAPGQRGTKRYWCEAESSDSPHQDNTKMRPESLFSSRRINEKSRKRKIFKGILLI
jgi:hypothetical protein